MANHHHAMTIRDYLEARYQRPVSRARAKQKLELRANDDSFRNLLDNKTPQTARESANGLTVVDYRAAAVSMRRRLPANKTPQTDPPDPEQKIVYPDRCAADRNECSIKAPASEAWPAETVQALNRMDALSRNDDGDNDPKSAINQSIHKAARKYNLKPGLIRAVIRAESNFQVDARSPAGAQGLMQLMPATARELGVSNSYDIDQNIDGGSRYLRQMLDRYSGNLKMALSAYNAGPGNVDKYGGRVPFAETRQYVDRVLRFVRKMA